jgi:hypothetical protein
MMQKREKTLLLGNFGRILLVAGVFLGFFGCEQETQPESKPEIKTEQIGETDEAHDWEQSGEVLVRLIGSSSESDKTCEFELMNEAGESMMRSRVYMSNDYTFNVVLPAESGTASVRLDQKVTDVKIEKGVIALQMDHLVDSGVAMN